MGRLSVSDTNKDDIKQFEYLILSKLLSDYKQQTFQTSHEDLMRSIQQAAESSLFDRALGGLIVRNSVSRIGGNDHYRITENGISEYENSQQ